MNCARQPASDRKQIFLYRKSSISPASPQLHPSMLGSPSVFLANQSHMTLRSRGSENAFGMRLGMYYFVVFDAVVNILIILVILFQLAIHYTQFL